MKKRNYLYLAIIIAGILSGCKPSEKNYEQAYRTAQEARQSARQADADLGIPELISTDGPRREVLIPGDTAYVRREALTLHGEVPQSGVRPANVAVGKYKMTANALSDAETLRKAGFDSFVLATSNGEFYTIAGSASTFAEAAEILRKVRKKFPDRPYIGLPGEPVIEVLLRSGL